MWITVDKQKAFEITDEVIKDLLSIYPEEGLLELEEVKAAFAKREMTIAKLQDLGRKIFIPWQMFLLSKEKLQSEIIKIEQIRQDKFSEKLLQKRQGQGKVTSKRILDRLIRIQNYIVQSSKIPNNLYCGLLKSLNLAQCCEQISSFFDIDLDDFRDKKDANRSLEYLVEKIQKKNINISRGVLSNGMLLHHQTVKGDIYKNTSGFVIKDECVPFIFLPSEINPDDVAYRQIYTLIYLLCAIGLGEYKYFVESDFTYSATNADFQERKIHEITSAYLLPFEVTEKMRGEIINKGKIDQIKESYKLSPTAILTILKIRKIITHAEFEELTPAPFIPRKQRDSKVFNPPKISTSVVKFCGSVAHRVIRGDITNGAIKTIPAQYLIFGRVNKANYAKYLKEIQQ